MNKKNAVSIENPDYLIKNNNYLINQNAKDFFYRADHSSYKKFLAMNTIIANKPQRQIHAVTKYGVSQDNPFIPSSINILVNTKQTSSIFEPYTNIPPVSIASTLKNTNAERKNHKSLGNFRTTKKYCNKLLDSSMDKDRKVMLGLHAYHTKSTTGSSKNTNFIRSSRASSNKLDKSSMAYTNHIQHNVGRR